MEGVWWLNKNFFYIYEFICGVYEVRVIFREVVSLCFIFNRNVYKVGRVRKLYLGSYEERRRYCC